MLDIHILRIIFRYDNIIRYFKIIFVIISIFIFIEIMTIDYIYKDTLDSYRERLNTIEKTEGTNIGLMCNIVMCEKLEYNGDVFISDHGILTFGYKGTIDKPKYFNLYDKDLKTIFRYKDIVFLLDNNRYIEIGVTLVFINSLLFIFIFTIGYIYFIYKDYRTKLIEKSSYILELETKLQRNISESLHHEMLTPISVIKTLIVDLYKDILPCNVSEYGICSVNTKYHKECSDCKKRELLDKDKLKMVNHYDKILLSISIIESILSHIAENKYIKYSNGNISIYKILVNVINSINTINVNKIHAEYKNREIMEKYAVSDSLGNGSFMSIINNHVTNSMEAKADTILFAANLLNKNKMELFIIDNGIGIRDKFGNIINTNEIFKSGYSNKDSDGNPIVYKNFIVKILLKLGITKKENIPRGVGLFINKKLLNDVGGDVTLISTSEKGTVFRLVVPIKNRV